MTATAPGDRAAGARAELIEKIGGYMTSHALGLAAELGIADLIGDGTRAVAELAEATGTHEPSLCRMLRLLAAAGVTTEPEPGRFALTDVGAQLRTGFPNSMAAFTRAFCHPAFFTAWEHLEHSVRTGERGFDHAFGTDFYGYIADRPELSALFNEAMSQESRIPVEALAAGRDFSAVKTVVDIGGGDGTALAAILGAHPHLRGIVFDTPSGMAGAPAVLAAAGLADRCEARAGDFFQEIPDAGDLYLIKSVLQDWDDERVRAILRTCHRHMPPPATLLIVGTVLPDTASPDTPIMFLTDLNMLVAAGGKERTETRLRDLLRETGFTVRSVTRGAVGPLSVIEAKPAA